MNNVITVDNLFIWTNSDNSLWRASYKDATALGRSRNEALQNLGLQLVSSLNPIEFKAE